MWQCWCTEEEERYQALPLYSRTLAHWLGAKEPIVQLGFYTTVLGGATFAANRLIRAHALVRYVEMSKANKPSEAMWYADLANVEPHQLKRAGRQIFRFSYQAFVGAACAPVLWLYYRAGRHELKEDA